MAFEVYNTNSSCKSCAKNNSNAKHKRHFHLPAPTGPLESVAMKTLGTLPETTEDNQHIVIITDRYPKLTRAVSTARIATNTEPDIFFNAWVVPYGIPV